MTKPSYDDVWSLDGLTMPEHVCGYELGCYLEIDVLANQMTLEKFQNGAIIAQHRRSLRP